VAPRRALAWGKGALGIALGTGCSVLAPLDGLSGAPIVTDAGEAATEDATDEDAGADSSPGDSGSPADGGGDTASTSDVAPIQTAYRRQVTVTNADTTTLPAGYAVRFALDTSALVATGKVRADLNDLRVTTQAGTDRDRVVDPGSPSTVWFALAQPIASGASDIYWVDYGAGDAGAAPADGAKVFAFYDDFATGTMLPHWLVSGAPVFAPGQVTFRQAQTDALTTNASSDGVPAASSLEIVASITDPASAAGSGNGFYYWLGYQHTGDFNASEPWLVWIARAAGEVHGEQYVSGSASCPQITSCVGGTLMQDTKSHVYRVDRPPSGTHFYRDGVDSYDVGDPSTVDYSLMLRNYAATSDLTVTRVRARPLAEREPMVTVGAEQAAP